MNEYSIAITLLLIMDPFGNIPYFLAALSHVKPSRRLLVLARELLIALALLLFFLFFGNRVLSGLGLSAASLGIAGGIILFIISLQMIFGRYRSDALGSPPEEVESELQEEPLIVPLAVPMIAGPSAMTMVILLSTQYPHQHGRLALALLAAWGGSSIILILSGWMAKYLERRVLKAIERLMGMILTAMAVEILLQGLRAFLAEL